MLAERAGVPRGLFNVVTGEPKAIGAEMTGNPIVRKLSFTGSTPVGRLLMAQCAPTVKKVSLELGGNAPFIVFDDADLDAAVAGAIASKYRNSGQTCVCTNRFYVHDKVYDAFAEKLRVADRVWTMRISYGRQFERLGRPFGIFLFGLALALLATQLHRVQQRRVGAAQALAEQQARHAEDRELMIGEMAHRMKNALARIGALARITLRESTSLEDFETRFDGRMRALSETKQMIVTGAVSRWITNIHRQATETPSSIQVSMLSHQSCCAPRSSMSCSAARPSASIEKPNRSNLRSRLCVLGSSAHINTSVISPTGRLT